MRLVEVAGEQMARLLDEVRNGRQVQLEQGRQQTQILRQAADELGDGAVLVQIGRDLDVSSHVPLSIAQRCGPEVLRQTAEQLRASSTNVAGWQAPLSAALRGKYLLVDGLEHLQSSRAEWDFPRLDALSGWLKQRAAITTLDEAQRCELQPIADSRFAAKTLWRLTEHDPERYALAVARETLLGPGARKGWDEPSLIEDLWDGMPLEMQRLVSLLATHGRPIQRRLFEDLELVSAGNIQRAWELALIEIHKGQLSLPRPWYTVRWQVDPAVQHRTLADAFAQTVGRGREGSNPLAVLEAHRHYSAIPDVMRALEFADFSVGPLLGAAVRQSRRGEHDSAAQSYEALLELERRSPGRLGQRTRGYVTHYLHYNRAVAIAGRPGGAAGESVELTLEGYRSALVDWPENALFWSRLVRKLFDARCEDEAMAMLREAYDSVPPHPERDRGLIVNTVDRLISRNLLLPAVFVWGSHSGRLATELAVAEQLDAQLASGFQTTRLWSSDVPATDVASPLRIVAIPLVDEGGWECSSDDLRRRNATRTGAMSDLMRALVFEILATRWRQETGGLSVMRAAYQHPAYQQILRLGVRVVPEILRLIERQPDHWHEALVQLTGENPVSPGERLTTSQVCARWVAWGRELGMRW